MKVKDEVIRSSGRNADPPNNLTSPNIATTPAVVGPLQTSVEGGGDQPLPREWTRAAVSSVRSGLGGDPAPGTRIAAAPTDDPGYDPVAREYQARESGLPMSVSAAQIARESMARTYNLSEGSRSPLAGTTVEEGDNDL